MKMSEERAFVKKEIDKHKVLICNEDQILVNVHDLHGKTVIIRVEDPVRYQEHQGAWTAKFLKGAGAASVIVMSLSDKIDVMTDEELKNLGLARIQ